MASILKTFRLKTHPMLWVVLLTWILWTVLMAHLDYWYYFLTKWFMSVTMFFGSFIAGSTSVGGGAVAFPVMTLVFGIKPDVARDFSLMIQSVGMMAASLTIVFLKIPVVWRAILISGLGGIIGIIIGMEFVAGTLTPSYTKTFFSSFWVSFGFALFLMNRKSADRRRQDFPTISSSGNLLLFFLGILGGIVSGITGSGLDTVVFSVLVLGFRVSEKIATSTSVVLMGTNALIGFLWKGLIGSGMNAQAWGYWYVCVPIVVVGAPLGAWFIKTRSRIFIVKFLLVCIAAQYVAALFIIPQTWLLLLFNGTTILAGTFLFTRVSRFGRRFKMTGEGSGAEGRQPDDTAPEP